MNFEKWTDLDENRCKQPAKHLIIINNHDVIMDFSDPRWFWESSPRIFNILIKHQDGCTETNNKNEAVRSQRQET